MSNVPFVVVCCAGLFLVLDGFFGLSAAQVGSGFLAMLLAVGMLLDVDGG